MAEIPLTQNQVALIDDDDFELVSRYKWRAAWSPKTKSFYATSTIRKPDGKRTTIQMHRLIMGANNDDDVDHIHHQTLDNRKMEIRLCTRSQNLCNTGLNANNTSGFKGVCWDKRARKWVAQIQTGGKRKHLGHFITPELANDVCMAARAELHGEFMNTGEV